MANFQGYRTSPQRETISTSLTKQLFKVRRPLVRKRLIRLVLFKCEGLDDPGNRLILLIDVIIV